MTFDLNLYKKQILNKIKYFNLYEGNRRDQTTPNFQTKGLLPDRDSEVVKRGHSSFVPRILYQGKSKVCPRFTKNNK